VGGQFLLPDGTRLGGNYRVAGTLGHGSEGEVYRIIEQDTGIQRAAKLYYKTTSNQGRLAAWHAQKLTRLRHCAIVLQYHHRQTVELDGKKYTCIISELCDGEPLEDWVRKQPGGRLPPYVALHVLYHLARGLEQVHGMGEYHSDVHSQNILIRPWGITFELKLVDFYNWGRPARYKRQQDLFNAVQVFYEILGGRDIYQRLPDALKYICAGGQRRYITRRFHTMTSLRVYLESFSWDIVPGARKRPPS
jgi:serine/threonine protein kinase